MVNFETSFLPKNLEVLFELLIPHYVLASKIPNPGDNSHVYALIPYKPLSGILGQKISEELTRDVLNHYGSRLPANVEISGTVALKKIPAERLVLDYFTAQLREAGGSVINIANRITVQIPQIEDATKLQLLLDVAVAQSAQLGRAASSPRRP